VLAVLASKKEHWISYLAPTLMRQGHQISRWQLGPLDRPEAFFTRGVVGLMQQIRTELRELAPNPQLILPWRLDQQRLPSLPDSIRYAITVPTGVDASLMEKHLEQWRSPSSDVLLHFELPDARQMPHDRRVAHTALRLILAWESQPREMMISSPWTEQAQPTDVLLPDPLLGVFANTARRLSGYRALGRLSVGDGMVCVVFNGPHGAMLAAWNEHAKPGRDQLGMSLGESPQVIDVWGNRRPLPLSDGKHQLRLTQTPQFIEGVDSHLAAFRMLFRLDNPRILSHHTPHKRVLTVANPWPHRMSGSLRFNGPEGWSTQPHVHHFTIPPGKSIELPITLKFPLSEEAGAKQLSAKATFSAGDEYDIEVATPMSLGLDNITYEATMAVEPNASGGENVVVVAVITNTGDEPVSLNTFANLQGHMRQERLIANIQPGETIVRRFTFENAQDQARQFPVRAGVRQVRGPAVLNKRLTLDGQ